MTELKFKDQLLIFLRDSSEPHKVETTTSVAAHLQVDEEKAIRLCQSIADDNYIVYHSGTPGACKIKNKGRDFIDQGGYENQELMRRLHAEKAETKEELEFQQLRSVIATNNATQRAYNIQKKQNRTSLLLVGAASILSLGTLLKEVFDSPPLDTETKQLLLMHARNQDSLKQVLQSIDSTFRAFTDSANKNSSRQ